MVFSYLLLNLLLVRCLAQDAQVCSVHRGETYRIQIIERQVYGRIPLVAIGYIEDLHAVGDAKFQKLQRAGAGNRAILCNPAIPDRIIEEVSPLLD